MWCQTAHYASLESITFIHNADRLSHEDARHLHNLALAEKRGKTVFIDLTHVADATTAAFAQLVLLRRALLQDGRDLRLTGLRERAAGLYHISRLDAVLPLD